MKQLISYISEGCWDKHLQKMLSEKASASPENAAKVIGVFKNDDPMDEETFRLYLNRELPLHNGIMEKTHIDFYKTTDKMMQLEYILTRTFIIDELDDAYKYPADYRIEFITNLEAELDLFIRHKDFDKLTEFTQDLFITLHNYTNYCLKKIAESRFSRTIEFNIKKDHNIK